jgi:hypothetical protein
MKEPYWKSNAPALPDPARVARRVSSRLLGWQCQDGALRWSVWESWCELDGGGYGTRWWTNTGGVTHYVTTCPRVDRAVEPWPA